MEHVLQAHHSRRMAVPLLLQGTVISMRTLNSQYRMVVLDGSTLHVRITGGWAFPEETDATVVGASDDQGDVESGWITEGMRLRLNTERGPVVTSAVESIVVDGTDAPRA